MSKSDARADVTFGMKLEPDFSEMEKARKATKLVTDEIGNSTDKMKGLGKQTGMSTIQMYSLAQATQQLGGYAQKLANVGKSITSGFAGALATLADVGKEIENNSNRLVALTGKSKQYAKGVIDSAFEIGRLTAFSSEQVARMGARIEASGANTGTSYLDKTITQLTEIDKVTRGLPGYAKNFKVSLTSMLTDLASLVAVPEEKMQFFVRGVERAFMTGELRMLRDELPAHIREAVFGGVGKVSDELMKDKDKITQNLYKFLGDKKAIGLAIKMSTTMGGIMENMREVPRVLMKSLLDSTDMFDDIKERLLGLFETLTSLTQDKKFINSVANAFKPAMTAFKWLLKSGGFVIKMVTTLSSEFPVMTKVISAATLAVGGLATVFGTLGAAMLAVANIRINIAQTTAQLKHSPFGSGITSKVLRGLNTSGQLFGGGKGVTGGIRNAFGKSFRGGLFGTKGSGASAVSALSGLTGTKKINRAFVLAGKNVSKFGRRLGILGVPLRILNTAVTTAGATMFGFGTTVAIATGGLAALAAAAYGIYRWWKGKQEDAVKEKFQINAAEVPYVRNSTDTPYGKERIALLKARINSKHSDKNMRLMGEAGSNPLVLGAGNTGQKLGSENPLIKSGVFGLSDRIAADNAYREERKDYTTVRPSGFTSKNNRVGAAVFSTVMVDDSIISPAARRDRELARRGKSRKSEAYRIIDLLGGSDTKDETGLIERTAGVIRSLNSDDGLTPEQIERLKSSESDLVDKYKGFIGDAAFRLSEGTGANLTDKDVEKVADLESAYMSINAQLVDFLRGNAKATDENTKAIVVNSKHLTNANRALPEAYKNVFNEYTRLQVLREGSIDSSSNLISAN